MLRGHRPALLAAGLITERPFQYYRGEDDGHGPVFVEIFEWVDGEAPKVAHDTPEILRVWEGMGALVEDRGENRPAMQFPHFRPIVP